MLNLKTRQLEPELMDDPNLDLAEHQRALQGLTRIHTITNSATQLWKIIKAQITASGKTEASLLDVGCGDGYMLRKFHTFAKRDGITLQLQGCDFSRKAIGFAEDLAKKTNTPIEFLEFDVTSEELLPRADYVICSLFLHHFEEPQVVKILQKLDQAATQLALVHDLRRTNLGYALCWIGVHALTTSQIVRTDGLLSVRAAFSVAEVRQMFKAARIENAEFTTGWPQRFTVSWPTQGDKA